MSVLCESHISERFRYNTPNPASPSRERRGGVSGSTIKEGKAEQGNIGASERWFNRDAMDETPNDFLPLLRKELRQARVNLNSLLPRWAKAKAIRETILHELAVAIRPEVHEGHVPPYGSFVGPPGQSLNMNRVARGDLNLARKAADGSTALLVHRGAEFEGLMVLPPTGTPELELARLARNEGAVVIRRDRTGTVRVFTAGGSLRHAHRQWSLSPSLEEAVGKTMRVASMLSPRLLDRLLEFAYYVLSSWHVGATLVWLLSDHDPFPNTVDLRELNASIDPTGDQPSLAFLAHLCAQYDGATVFDKHGLALKTGVHLRPTERSEELIPASAGTRHTSARRASYDHADVLIITVSSDGPVTVFSDGLGIFSISWFSADAYADRLRSLPYAEAWSSCESCTCSNCGKSSVVEAVTLAGWRGHESAECPVCRHTIAEGNCWHMQANLRKVLPKPP